MAANEDPFRLFLPSFNSPEAMDSAMAGTMEESDTDFFTSAYNTAFNSPGQMLMDDTLLSSPGQPLQDTSRPNTMNPAESHSAESSPPDSSSDSSARHKRNASSNSSQSALVISDVSMTDDTQPALWKGGMAAVKEKGLENDLVPADADIDLSNRAMEHDFDFDSAASSPSPPPDPKSLSSGIIKGLKMPIRSPRPGPASGLNHQYGISTGSFEPHSSTMMKKAQDAWSTSITPTFSAAANLTTQYPNGFSLGGMPQNVPLPLANASTTYDGSGSVSPAMTYYATAGMPYSPHTIIGGSPHATSTSPKLFVHPVREKSRVETQIAIKLTLHPIPPGITKLHLQTHTISKPKLIARPTPMKSPEMLEMYAMLVCTSAMQDPAKVQRALARAAGAPTTVKEEGRRSSAGGSPSPDDDENKPLNGGPVNICAGCITRERKRAGRKKSKNKEEEELWQEDEAKRIIVFNTHEVKDWQSPPKPKSGSQSMDSGSEYSSPPPIFPEDAMQVELPMRIACYCRHQEEKLGFQVIFTLKDHQDKVVAQAMTNSIVVTDDHKNPSEKAREAANAFPSKLPRTSESVQFPGPGVVFKECIGPRQFTHAHSTTDLQGLQHDPNPQYMQHVTHFNNPQITSQPVSVSTTPYNLSRPPSPSLYSGQQSKRRKTSGVGKLPDGLTMTRLPNSHGSGTQTSGAGSSGPTYAQGSHIPNYSNFSSSTDRSIQHSAHHGFSRSTNGGQATCLTFPPNTNPPTPLNNANFVSSPVEPNSATPSNSHYSLYPSASSTNPPTPNHIGYNFFSNTQRSQSMDDLSALQGTPSAPNISRQSQIPSSMINQQNHDFDTHQAHVQGPMGPTNSNNNTSTSLRNHAQALATSLNGLPGAPYQPTILEVFPASGPKSGGIKVILLGSGFREGLEVLFGTALAPNTIYWGEKCLVCTLPPSTEEMTVRVTLLDRLQQAQTDHQQPVQFRYVDDNKQQLMELALAFLNHKYTGRDEHAEDVARNILNSLSSSNIGLGSGSSLPQGSMANADLVGSMDLEASLMKCLDLVDLADSPFKAQLNAQRPNGQSMLHFSASLGYLRLVAGLLARGADPDLRDHGGFTPMHMAALNGHLQIVKKLRSSGGDPTLRSLRGATPADMAASREIRETASIPDHHTRSRSVGATMVSASQVTAATTLQSAWRVRSATDLLAPEDGFSGNTEVEVPEASCAIASVATISSKPPAYEEIYPQSTQQAHEVKKVSTIRAVGEALIDQKCIEAFDTDEVGTSSVTVSGSNTAMRKIREVEDATSLIVVPKEVKRLRSDRKLWFIWLPILIFVGLAMLKDWIPQLRSLARQPFDYLQQHLMV